MSAKVDESVGIGMFKLRRGTRYPRPFGVLIGRGKYASFYCISTNEPESEFCSDSD